MIDPAQLLDHVIRPVLKEMGAWSIEAERLVLGTACAESECGRWLKQRGGGPALGIYQCEPATHQDCWVSYLQFKPALARKVLRWSTSAGLGWPPEVPEPSELTGNLFYATAICRVHYLRDPEKIPDTLMGQALAWKRCYNSFAGKGTVDGYIRQWQRFVPAGTV
jgi:hypothetical protein